jgi:large subunit ribosomal protein L22e
VLSSLAQPIAEARKADPFSPSLTAPGTITVISSIPMSKRYIKYLSKRFLKRNSLREWLRVVSTSPSTYTLKFFDTEEAADDEE